MKRALFTLLPVTAVILTGCGDVNNYHAQIISSPAKANYEKDLATCKVEGKQRHQMAIDSYQSSGSFLMAGTFGVAGAAVGSQVGPSDYNKSLYDFIDECLEAKGYKLVR